MGVAIFARPLPHCAALHAGYGALRGEARCLCATSRSRPVARGELARLLVVSSFKWRIDVSTETEKTPDIRRLDDNDIAAVNGGWIPVGLAALLVGAVLRALAQ